MSTAATAAPSPVRTPTVSRPIAPAAPVTTQTLPSRAPTHAPAGRLELVSMPWDLRGGTTGTATLALPAPPTGHRAATEPLLPCLVSGRFQGRRPRLTGGRPGDHRYGASWNAVSSRAATCWQGGERW